MSDDIVNRLRGIGERVLVPCPDKIKGCLVAHYRIETDPTCAEAADEIERLREALRLTDAALSGAHMNMSVVERKVRAALAKGEVT